MATLHGFPILVTGQRWCVVDLPESWAIMDSLDTVPTPVFEFQKDESGWREAVAQLQRSDVAPPTIPTVVTAPTPPPVRHGRRQFSLARFGILLSAVVLGVSPWLPWASIQVTFNGEQSSIHGNLFKIMNHGWRNSVAEILVGLAVVCGVQALVLPFPRIALASAILGFLSLVPVILGVTQVHTYVGPGGPGFSHPPVSIGYGVFVAFGGCLLLVMAWALFPTGLRRPSKRAGAAGPAAAGPTRTGHVHIMEGLTRITPPPPTGVGAAAVAGPLVAPPGTAPTSAAAAAGAAGSAGKTASSSGLPTLGAALAQLAEHDRQGVVTEPRPVRPEPDGLTGSSPSAVAPDPVPAERDIANPRPVDIEPAPSATSGAAAVGVVPVPAEPEVAVAEAQPEPEVAEVQADPEVAEPEAVVAELPPEPEVQPEVAEVQSEVAEPEVADSYAPGWYADYADPSLLRYWDGAEWTEYTHPADG
jgi:hypothetical protein